MEEEDQSKLSLEELFKLAHDLFPQGPAGNDVLAELAPDGWESSELIAVAHPSVDKRFEEATQFHENMK